jgi:hypothetical protein
VEQGHKREELKSLSEDELLRRAARELCITSILVFEEIQRQLLDRLDVSRLSHIDVATRTSAHAHRRPAR